MTEHAQENGSDLFVVLGSASPQRFEVLWQMADYLLFHGESVEVWHHEEEIPPESPALSRLLEKELKLRTWSLREDACRFDQAPQPTPGVTAIFLSHGVRFLVDTLETLALWMPDSGFQLQRITTWVDCKRVNDSSTARKWYECCFHFSDLVILDEFKDLPVSWLKEYKDFFKKECYPCIIDNTRKGRLHDLFMIMDNPVMRIAQVFEKPDDLPFVEIEMSSEEDDDEEEASDGIDATDPAREPYFERMIDGKRSKVVPDPY
jgi:hypothetical protein